MPEINQNLTIPKGTSFRVRVDVGAGVIAPGLTYKWRVFPYVDGLPNRDEVLLEKDMAQEDATNILFADLAPEDTEGFTYHGNYHHEVNVGEAAGAFIVTTYGVLTLWPVEGARI